MVCLKTGKSGVGVNDIIFPRIGVSMKIHSNYTLYWRVVPSGKRVVYYYAWDENNKRRGGYSTGQTTVTAAKLHCDKLLREGKLVPNSDFMPAFAGYAQGWWEWET